MTVAETLLKLREQREIRCHDCGETLNKNFAYFCEDCQEFFCDEHIHYSEEADKWMCNNCDTEE